MSTIIKKENKMGNGRLEGFYFAATAAAAIALTATASLAIAKIGLFVLVSSSCVQPDDDHSKFPVHPGGCAELVGVGPVSQSNVAPLAPRRSWPTPASDRSN